MLTANRWPAVGMTGQSLTEGRLDRRSSSGLACTAKCPGQSFVGAASHSLKEQDGSLSRSCGCRRGCLPLPPSCAHPG